MISSKTVVNVNFHFELIGPEDSVITDSPLEGFVQYDQLFSLGE